MARIRSIKPEFWTDETLTECSLSARLLFIGMWNFADDRGNISRSTKQLKMKIFPADNIDVSPYVDELITHGLLIEYSVSGKNYLHIKGFTKHQVINRPSKSSIPDYEDSLNTHGTLTEDSLREGKGREGNITTSNDVVCQTENSDDDKTQVLKFKNQSRCPHQDIVKIYNEILGDYLPIVERWDTNSTRARHLAARWREDHRHQDVEFWHRMFVFIRDRNPFLIGQGPPRDNGKPWRASLAWIVNPENFTKIIEKHYVDDKAVNE